MCSYCHNKIGAARSLEKLYALVAFALHTQRPRVRFSVFLNFSEEYFQGKCDVAKLIDRSALHREWTVPSLILLINQTYPVLARGTLYCKNCLFDFDKLENKPTELLGGVSYLVS